MLDQTLKPSSIVHALDQYVIARPVGLEIVGRQPVGAALQSFERKPASDRGLSAVPASRRLVRRRARGATASTIAAMPSPR